MKTSVIYSFFLIAGLLLTNFQLSFAQGSDLQEWPNVVRNWDGATSELLNANGLGKCYDVRFIDPTDLTKTTILGPTKERTAVKLYINPNTTSIDGLNRNYMAPMGVTYLTKNGAQSKHVCEVITSKYDFENKITNNLNVSISGESKKAGGSASYSRVWGNTTKSSTGNESVNMYATMTKTFYKLTLQLDGSYNHVLDPVFVDYVERLGVDVSPEGFIYTFGSHYAGAAIYGGMFISSTTVNKSTYEYSSLDEDEWKAEASLSYKGVTASVGGGQSQSDLSAEFRSQMNSNHQTFSVGGDQQSDNIEQWAPTVANKLSVVGVDLIRLSSLLTPKNFPNIKDISQKRNILDQAIARVEQEADQNKADKDPANFFQKTPVTFTYTVESIGGGSTDDEGTHNELEVYGKLNMGIYTSSGIPLSEKTVFQKSDDDAITCGNNTWKPLNMTISYVVPAEHVSTGYASVWGNLLEYDETIFDADDNFSVMNKDAGIAKFPLGNLTSNGQRDGKEVKFSCPDNGYIYVKTTLSRSEPNSSSLSKQKPSESELRNAVSSNNMVHLRKLIVEKDASIANVNGILDGAIAAQNLTTLNTLMDYGARPTQNDLDKVFNATTLNPQMAIALMERGAVPNQNHFEKAVSSGNKGVILACVRNGMAPNSNHLRTMMNQNKPEVAKSMMKYSSISTNTDDLNQAIDSRDLELVKLMVDKGGSSVQPQSLQKAVATNNQEIVAYILPLTPASHETLEVTSNMNDTENFQYFIEKGARLNNNLPLNKAIDNRNYEILQMSLDNGGDANAAVAYALGKNDQPALEKCLAAGGQPNPAIKFSVDKNDKSLYEKLLNTYSADADTALFHAIRAKKIDFATAAIATGRPNSSNQLKSVVPLGLNWVELLVGQGGADPNTALMTAVENEKNDVLSYLISQNANATSAELLVRAVETQNIATVTVLVKEGNANAENGRVKAIELGNVQITSLLLDNGATATGMSVPAKTGNLEMVKLLHQRGCDVNEGIMESVKNNHTSVALYLLDNDASIQGLLAETAKHGNASIGKKLLDRGANPNEGILTAVKGNHTDLSMALLEANAKIDGLMNIAAGQNGNKKITAKLIEMGGDVNEGIKGAVQNKFLDVAQVLIENEADVSESEFLVIAINNNDHRMAQLLFDSGTDVNYIDHAGNNFLHTTADDDGRITIVKTILTFGLDIEARNNAGQTALHLAAMSGKDNLQVVRALLEAGACPNALTRDEKTVFNIAKSRKVKKLIQEFGGEKKADSTACN